MSQRAVGLDVIRAGPLACVLVAHGSLFFTSFFFGGRYLLILLGVPSVEAFFALSGFLVGRQLLLVCDREADALAFVIRRWYRTLPNYYLFLAVNAILAWWVLAEAPQPRASYLVFSQSLASPAAVHFFPESWSLAIEEWFYGLAALAFGIFAFLRWSPRAVGWFLIAVILTEPIARYLAQEANGLLLDAGVRKIALLHLDALAFGLGAAWIERHRQDWFDRLCRWPARLAGVALLAFSLVVLTSQAHNLDFFYRVPETAAERWMGSLLFSAMALATALWLPWFSRWEEWKSWLAVPTMRMSDWSYSVYLTHLPTMAVLTHVWPLTPQQPWQLALRTLVWITVTIGLAAFVFRYYERPIMDLRPPLKGGKRKAKRVAIPAGEPERPGVK